MSEDEAMNWEGRDEVYNPRQQTQYAKLYSDPLQAYRKRGTFDSPGLLPRGTLISASGDMIDR